MNGPGKTRKRSHKRSRAEAGTQSNDYSQFATKRTSIDKRKNSNDLNQEAARPILETRRSASNLKELSRNQESTLRTISKVYREPVVPKKGKKEFKKNDDLAGESLFMDLGEDDNIFEKSNRDSKSSLHCSDNPSLKY